MRQIRIRANHRHCVRPSVRPSDAAISQIARRSQRRRRGRAGQALSWPQIRHEARRHQTGLHFSLFVTKWVRYCGMISAAVVTSPARRPSSVRVVRPPPVCLSVCSVRPRGDGAARRRRRRRRKQTATQRRRRVPE